MISAGVQGQAYAKILKTLKPFEQIWISDVDERWVSNLPMLDDHIPISLSIFQIVAQTDVILMCISATAPALQTAWLKYGVPIASKSFTPPGSEPERKLVEGNPIEDAVVANLVYCLALEQGMGRKISLS